MCKKKSFQEKQERPSTDPGVDHAHGGDTKVSRYSARGNRSCGDESNQSEHVLCWPQYCDLPAKCVCLWAETHEPKFPPETKNRTMMCDCPRIPDSSCRTRYAYRGVFEQIPIKRTPPLLPKMGVWHATGAPNRTQKEESSPTQ